MLFSPCPELEQGNKKFSLKTKTTLSCRNCPHLDVIVVLERRFNDRYIQSCNFVGQVNHFFSTQIILQTRRSQ